MKKSKLILSIVIPCASVAVATAIIVPAACLATNNPHMTHDVEDRVKYLSTTSYSNVIYTYNLKDKDIDVSCLKADWTYALSSHHKLHISDIALSLQEGNKLTAKLTILNGEDKQPSVGDTIGFDIRFTYIKDNKAQWSADFVSNLVYFSRQE